MFQVDLVRVMWGVLPGAILWGASFPLALAAVSSRGQDPGKLVGGVYAANTLGAIIGALVFAILLIPQEQIGTVGCERILVGLCLLSALIVFVPMLWEPRTDEDAAPLGAPELAFGIALVVVALCGGVYLISAIEPMPPVAVAWGRNSAEYGASMGPGIIKESEVGGAILSHPRAERFCIFVGEGMNVSAAVTMSREGYKYFHGAGKVQASTDPRDMRLQRMLGHISALTFTNHAPEKVLVVACGAGVTAGSFIPYDSVKREVICDIEPLVPQKVTPQFGPQNYHIVDNIANENPHMVDGKQVEVVYDDGRHFVRVTQEMFDVITSDPIDPWVKGCAALNTIEYYTMCSKHLNPGGVMALWIPLYESNLDTFKSVLETFFTVFPNGIVWSNDNGQGGYDAVLFGQMEPTRIDLDETDRWIAAHPKVAKSLQDVGFGNTNMGGSNSFAVDLYSSYAGSATSLVEWGQGAQINKDSNLRLQYLAGMSVNTYMNDEILHSMLKYYTFPKEMFRGSPQKMQQLQEAFERAGRTGHAAVAVQDSAR
jgi:spermidine synthase